MIVRCVCVSGKLCVPVSVHSACMCALCVCARLYVSMSVSVVLSMMYLKCSITSSTTENVLSSTTENTVSVLQ